MRIAAEDVTELVRAATGAHRRMWASASRLTEHDCRAPSLLPGWTRGHLLTHWARNADGQSRMLLAAMRSSIAAQYAGGDGQRNADIEAGAARRGRQILDDVGAAVGRLEDVWRRMPADAWSRPTAARAGQRPAWMSVWARWRETEIHHVDLSVGYGHGDWAEEFVDLMLPRVAATLSSRVSDEVPIRVQVTDRDEATIFSTTIFSTAAADPVVVRGPASAVLCWLAGRPVAADDVTATLSGQPCQLPGLRPWA